MDKSPKYNEATQEMRLVKDIISMEGRKAGFGGTLTQARGHRSTDCRCGQQLDMCARAHCPRCGRSINHR